MQCSTSHRQRAQTQSRVARGSIPLTERLGYSPAEFAASCGRHPSWAYRLLYGGKVKALTNLGRILIPASELERILAAATLYNPQPRKGSLRQNEGRGEGGIYGLCSDAPLARSDRKYLRHATGGDRQ
jgi:hypothetical protein